MNRRDFIRTSTLTGIAASAAIGPNLFAAHHKSAGRKFTINFVGGALGIKADQKRSIELAHQYGFESVEAQANYLADLSKEQLNDLQEDMAKKKVSWGSSGLPVDFRKDRAKFEEDLKELPKLAAGLKRAGVTRVNTWIMPSHDELTYNENFKQHTRRLWEAATILRDNDLRLGFEYVGTTTLLIRGKYPFLHTLAETQELCAAIGTGNVGYVLDSWHWWQAGDSAEAITKLDPKSITLVDLNDAPKGVDKQQQQDGQRELPLATGVIDLNPFLKALVKIGYDGPARAEPFNQPLRDLDDDAACKATIASLKKAMALIG
ncbi:MAG: sugar phosphate isomerase/epimerase [Verrucomicrobia bacterium]|nr:sugar phosphate isomerase/epimerase [Verrucomicrobiota bacterium]MDA1065037.1 sugar phosphate isomerase/epimerase [Verrucomicrobiota bacterium]